MTSNDAPRAAPEGQSRTRTRVRLRAADVGFFLIPVLLGMWYLEILHYLLGMINVLMVFPLLFLITVPIGLALYFMFSLPLRILRTRRGAGRARVWFHWLAAATGVAFFVLAFVAPAQESPFVMVARGFKVNMQIWADIEGIRTWLSVIDPNVYLEQHGHVETVVQLDEADWPKEIASLRPRWVRLFRDEREGLRVWIRWGGGFIGSWGLVVGDKQMPTPPSDFEKRREYYVELEPGAYVWADLD